MPECGTEGLLWWRPCSPHAHLMLSSPASHRVPRFLFLSWNTSLSPSWALPHLTDTARLLHVSAQGTYCSVWKSLSQDTQVPWVCVSDQLSPPPPHLLPNHSELLNEGMQASVFKFKSFKLTTCRVSRVLRILAHKPYLPLKLQSWH